MRQWDGPKRLRDRPGSILGSLRAPRGTPDADRDASNWSPNLVLGVSQGPDRSSSLSSVTRPLIFGAGRRARAGSDRCFGNKTFGALLLEQNFRHSVEDFSHAKSRSNFENDDATTPAVTPRPGQNIAFGTKLSAPRRGFRILKTKNKLQEQNPVAILAQELAPLTQLVHCCSDAFRSRPKTESAGDSFKTAGSQVQTDA